MTKIEKVNDDINKKFGVKIKMLKLGGRWSIMPEKGHNIDSKKMAEIREYVLMHSQELEEDDNI